MKYWRSVSQLFQDRRASVQKTKRLHDAYRRVFQGSPSEEDQEIVLADLAYYAGFSMVSIPDHTSDAQLRHNEGKRDLFARIRAHLNVSHEDELALENAARREAAVFYELQAQ